MCVVKIAKLIYNISRSAYRGAWQLPGDDHDIKCIRNVYAAISINLLVASVYARDHERRSRYPER